MTSPSLFLSSFTLFVIKLHGWKNTHLGNLCWWHIFRQYIFSAIILTNTIVFLRFVPSVGEHFLGRVDDIFVRRVRRIVRVRHSFRLHNVCFPLVMAVAGVFCVFDKNDFICIFIKIYLQKTAEKNDAKKRAKEGWKNVGGCIQIQHRIPKDIYRRYVYFLNT